MADALAAYGTLLKIGDGATPENFTAIAQVMSIGGPHFSTAMKDFTHHASTSAMAERVPTIKDAVGVDLKINFLPTEATQSYATGLLLDWHNRTKRNWKMVLPDTGSYELAFAGYVSKFDPDAPVDGVLTASVTISITGAVTFTP